MQTVNISLPKSLATKIDQVINREGYASRSEFIRALIRFYLLSQEKEEITLLPFRKIPLKSIRSQMQASGRYSDKFVSSVIKGLSRSSLYAKDEAST